MLFLVLDDIERITDLTVSVFKVYFTHKQIVLLVLFINMILKSISKEQGDVLMMSY